MVLIWKRLLLHEVGMGKCDVLLRMIDRSAIINNDDRDDMKVKMRQHGN